MIDKNKYTAFIKDEETKIFIIKNISKIEGVMKHHDIRKTDFMNPYEQSLFISVLNSFSKEVSYTAFGGNDECERKLFVIYPIYIEDVDCPLKLLRLHSNFKFEKISHRDCLGALMSIGLTRQKIGDIHLHKDEVDIVIEEDTSNYMVSNISSIKNCSVKAQILPIEDLRISKPDILQKNYSLSSTRLDNLIAEAFNLSRNSASSIIKSKKVKVNYEPVETPSKEIFENSLVSVRGYGRFIFLSSNGLSKKGKLRVSLGHLK